MQPSAEQKTEKPTHRRRRRAREEGQVAQSVEINNALVLLAGAGAMALFGGQAFDCLADCMTGWLGNLGAFRITQEATLSAAHRSVMVLARAALPMALLVGSVGLLCSLVQTGVLFVPKKLAPDLKAIDPVKGLKNIFSLTALMRLVTAAIKITVVGLVIYLLMRSRMNWLAALVGKSAWGILYVSRKLCLMLTMQVAAAMTGVAILDYAYQRRRHEKQLMMTKQELREERKRDEGDPEIRGRQASMRRAIARSRMMQAVPTANVVVSNPSHVAVALRWDEKAMSAPQVVAKGKDFLAQRIKQIARDNGVPVLERRELAWALYEAVEVGMEIPYKLYYAVAQVLAFVMKQKKRR